MLQIPYNTVLYDVKQFIMSKQCEVNIDTFEILLYTQMNRKNNMAIEEERSILTFGIEVNNTE